MTVKSRCASTSERAAVGSSKIDAAALADECAGDLDDLPLAESQGPDEPSGSRSLCSRSRTSRARRWTIARATKPARCGQSPEADVLRDGQRGGVAISCGDQPDAELPRGGDVLAVQGRRR